MEAINLEINLFGPIAVSVQGKPLPPVRTQKCLWILALLALRHGRSLDREEIAEILWPESDLEKARYNLRRALSDLRTVLGEGNGALLSISQGLCLDRRTCWVDVALFDTLLRPPAKPEHLEQAIALYSGPLLEGCHEEWASQPRQEREVQYVSALEQLAEHTIQEERYHAAIPLLQKVLLVNPLRASAVRSLIVALARTGNPAEMHQVYRDFYVRLLDLRQSVDPETVAIYHYWSQQFPSLTPAPWLPGLHRKPSMPLDWRQFTPPGGIMPLDSPDYIVREMDQWLDASFNRGDSIALIKGPRQTGKSSLLARGVEFARQNAVAVAITDVESLRPSALHDLNNLIATLADSLAEALDTDLEDWDGELSPMVALERWMRRQLRNKPEQRILWVLDGIDGLFAQPYRDDFFALIRSWHTKRAFDPTGPWQRLTVALTYSTEAQRFITNPNQSPFNVGTQISLVDFTPELQDVFQERYGNPLQRTSERERFRYLVGGHPFLTHRGLYALASGEVDLETLEASPLVSSATPFHAHLVQLREDISADPLVADGVRQVLQGDGAHLGDSLFYRMCSTGILIGETRERARFRCGLYEKFLRREFGQ